jgi:N-methylhydantoinase A/oxoprolinase/acetone carboxylase beta subunit
LYSIDIDIGGTFTDGFFTDGTAVQTAKVLTSPHDVTEGFLDCVRLGSERFDLALDEFLRRTAVARLSTTIGTNLLVQRKGARIGLLVTEGNETTLYGNEPAKACGEIVARDMVLGITETVDDAGRAVLVPSGEQVLAHVRALIQKGAEIIVVSLCNSWRNPANEQAARALVRARYPIHYLRSVPVQLGIEVVHDRDDHARTNSALLNAYIHAEMARVLFRAEDKLRAAGYPRPLLIVHSSGGNARVTKTVALNTLHSGPAVAVKGAAELSRWLGLDHVVSADMGGTSFDIGVVLNRNVSLEPFPQIEDMRIATPVIQVASVALGGGSIASANGNEVKLGPESAGSAPGPACYGKGGTEPTVTDANLLLGFIDADNFLGGRMKLDTEAATRAVQRRLGRRLELSVEEAACRIRRMADEGMAREVASCLRSAGQNPADVTLFSVGGAGPLHACNVAHLAGLKQVVVFPFGSVFSAFGGGTTDVQHLYRHTFGDGAGGAEQVDKIVEAIVQQARRDMQGEGFALSDVPLMFEVGLDEATAAVEGPSSLDSAEFSRRILAKANGTPIDLLRACATSATPHWRQQPLASRPSLPPPRGRRDVWWSKDGPASTPIYDRDALQPGASIDGPAIVEAPDTTYAVNPGWSLTVNELAFFVISRARTETAS